MMIRTSKLDPVIRTIPATPIKLSVTMLGVVTFMQRGAILDGYKSKSPNTYFDSAGLDTRTAKGHYLETVTTSTVYALLQCGAIEIVSREDREYNEHLTYGVTERMKVELKEAETFIYGTR